MAGVAVVPPAPSASLRVRVRLAFLVVVLGTLYVATYGAKQYSVIAQELASWWPPVSAATNIAALVCVAAAVIRRSDRLIVRSTTLLAVGYAATFLSWFVAWDGTVLPDDVTTQLEGSSVVAAMAAAIAWRMPATLGYAVLVTVLTRVVHFAAVETIGFRFITVAVAGNMLLTLVLAALTRVAVDSATKLDESWTHHHANAARAAEEQARLAERGRIADLLHDFVLAALLAAARQPDSAAVRDEARLALDNLRRYSEHSPPTVTADVALVRIDARCRAVDGVQVAAASSSGIHRLIDFPGTVVDAFADGAREAVRNSRRHGGPGVVISATITADPDRLEVSVADDGPGFSGSENDGYGLTRLRERFGALPGAALHLETDRGTNVRMIWERPGLSTASAPADFRSLLGLRAVHVWTATAVFCVGALVCGVAYVGAGTPAWASAVTIALACAAAIALFFPLADPLSREATAFVACTIPLAEGLLLAVSVAPITSAMLGPGYIAAPFALVLGLRGRLWAATALTAGCAAIPFAFLERSGLPVSYWLTQVMSWAVGLFLCVFFARTLRPVMSELRHLSIESTQRHAAGAASAEATRHRARHLATIEDSAMPILTAIAEGPLTPERRRTAALTEARLRGALRAPGLIDRRLDAAVTHARIRGVVVVLIDDSTNDPFRDRESFERFTSVAAAELDAAPQASTVTIRLTPPHAAARATVVTIQDGDTMIRVAVDDAGRATRSAPRTR